MRDDEILALLEELAISLQESRLEIRVLREVLVDSKAVTEEELALRLEDARREAAQDLEKEARRRAVERTLSGRAKQ